MATLEDGGAEGQSDDAESHEGRCSRRQTTPPLTEDSVVEQVGSSVEAAESEVDWLVPKSQRGVVGDNGVGEDVFGVFTRQELLGEKQPKVLHTFYQNTMSLRSFELHYHCCPLRGTDCGPFGVQGGKRFLSE